MIAEMSREEFQAMLEQIVEAAVERKLSELLNDLDEGLEIRQELMNRLMQQQQAVVDGERGDSLEEVLGRVGIG